MHPLKVVSLGRICLACLIACLLVAACQPASAAPAGSAVSAAETVTPAPVRGVQEPSAAAATTVPTAAPSPTAWPVQVWLPDYLPEDLRSSLEIPPGIPLARSEQDAAIRLVVHRGTSPAANTTSWVYALVAPFPTLADEISLVDLQNTWRHGAAGESAPRRLLVDARTRAVFEILWGKASGAVRTLPATQLVDAAWKENGTWAIVPFEQLEPHWKVLAVSGQSPVQKAFDPLGYGLTVQFELIGKPDALAEAPVRLPAGNLRPDKLTTVVLTGVTALVRGTASLMETRGMTYPAQDTGDWLREADILHINNEVPFARNCPQPHNWVGLVFCSQTEYIELLESIGTDVVELSGDHFQDWGPEATLYTIDLYEERGWQYYGGGRNAADARRPALFEHNGNKIAFIGCNAKPPGYSGASDTTPGAVHCDFDLLTQAVRQLHQDGYLPIVTFQHLEYYRYTAHPILQEDFARVAEAGAVIVSGSQAHQPHALEFRDGALLHYGLGNLFFDQTNQGDPPRTAFIDRHVFYNGRHISTELLTIYFVDYARARPMTEDERRELLRTVFEASGWQPSQ